MNYWNITYYGAFISPRKYAGFYYNNSMNMSKYDAYFRYFYNFMGPAWIYIMYTYYTSYVSYLLAMGETYFHGTGMARYYINIPPYYAYTAPKYYYNAAVVVPPYYAYTPAIETNPIHYTYIEV